MKPRRRDNSYLIILFACLASITAIACGSIYLRGRRNANEEPITITSDDKVMQNDYDHFLDENETTTAYQTVVEPQPDEVNDDIFDSEDENVENEDDLTEEDENNTPADEDNAEDSISDTVDAQQVAAPAILPFSQEKTIFWPVDGNILLEFNMDSTIYFPTLDAYKCNSALMIQSDVDTPVRAGVQSVIEEIGYQEEIGNYITVSLGDGYELTYGQLDKINVEQGQEVTANDVIGYVSEPTKYYSKEGCNLYLKLTKDDTALDPLDYLCYE